MNLRIASLRPLFSRTAICVIEWLTPMQLAPACLIDYFSSVVRLRQSTGGRMRFVLISTFTLLCAAPLLAQGSLTAAPLNNPAATTSTQQRESQQALPEGKPSPTAAEVTPDTPVVTLEGICDEPRSPGTKGCKTVITREQMDSLIDMVLPGASPAARSTFAISYARLLAAADASLREHLEKEPAVAAELQAQAKLAPGSRGERTF